jgi:hypothetical protein
LIITPINRLWNHVCRQQAMLTMVSDDWLFEQQQSPSVQTELYVFKPEQDIPNKDQWSWLDTKEPVLLDSLNEEETTKKRARSTEEHHSSKKPKSFYHFSTIDSPASPAGPASSASSSPTSAVLLSA